MPSLSGGLGGAATGALSGLAAGGPFGALAGGVIGGLSGLFGGSDPTTKARTATLNNVPNLINQGNVATGQGISSLGNAGRFYNTILGGNKEAISDLLNPQIGTVLGQYDNAAKSVAQFAPRGGGTTQTLAQLPFQKATTAGSAYQSALPGAAAGAASVGSAEGGLGNAVTNSASSALSPNLSYQTGQNTLQAGGAAGLGKTIASAGSGLGAILAKLLGKGGSSGGNGGGSFSLPSFGDAGIE